MDKQQKLEFAHLVTDGKGLVFASARDYANHIYNFFVNTKTGIVLEQIHQRFALVNDDRAERVRQALQRCYGVIPTYQIAHFRLN